MAGPRSTLFAGAGSTASCVRADRRCSAASSTADALDELCITISPSLEAGDARRIAHGDAPPREMRLATALRSGDTLLLRYARQSG